MAKDIKRHISHLKSSGTTAPAAADLVYGEIAVGYGAGNEVLYIKNSSDNVIPFVNGVSALAEAEAYADSGDVTSVTGDTEITVSLSDKASSGRTLTVTHASGSAQSGFKKLSSDSYGHITGGSNVALSDLTGLGALSGVTSGTGIAVGTKASGAQSISLATTGTAGTYKQVVVDAYGRVTSGNTADNNTWRSIKVNGTDFLTDTSTALNLSGGSNVTLTTGSTGLITIAATDTTYTAATAAPNNVATASSVGTSAKYAREDHTHAISLATGDANGQVKIAGKNIDVKGLGNAAYLNTGTTAGTVAAGDHTHANMVTGTSLTSDNIVLGAGNSAVKASTYGVETSLSSTLDTKIPTSKAIADYVTSQMVSVLTYKGTVNQNSDLPASHKVGDVYVVASAGTYAGKACEVGDYIICNTSGTTASDSHWDVVNGENQVENKSATLAWNSAVTIATVDGTNITAKLPANPNNDTWRNIKVNGTEKLGTGTSTGALAITSGSTNGTISVAGTDVAVKGLGGAAYLNTGTTAGTVAAGDHTHSEYANQNAFSNVKVGSTTIAADTTTDTLELSGGTFITLTPDATNDKVSIEVNTGTSSSTVAVGNHTHSIYATSAFTTVSVVGASTVNVVADQKHDTITFDKDDAIKLTGDATNDKVTFGLGDIVCGDYA